MIRSYTGGSCLRRYLGRTSGKIKMLVEKFSLRRNDLIPINRRRLLELAAERLEAEKQRIDEEIAEIRAELEGKKSTPKTRSKTETKPPTRKRRSRKLSAKERRVISARMKKYWAERKKKEKQQANPKKK